MTGARFMSSQLTAATIAHKYQGRRWAIPPLHLMAFFRRYLVDINLQDKDRVQNEKERCVPFSAPPFHEEDDSPENHADRHLLLKAEDDFHRVHVGQAAAVAKAAHKERHPEWLELSGDLAWTATFSSLTNAAQITDTSGVWNYTVFFFLTWHLWGTQAVYDISYYSNDWFHRAAFALQLMGYATLSAFSGDFKVLWGLNDAPDFVDPNDTTAVLTARATETHDLNSMKASFQGVNAMLFINRFFLLLEYTRILYYRRKHRRLSWGSLLTPIALFISAFIFLGCFILISVGERTKPVAILQICLWGAAVVIQILAQFFTPDERQDALFADTDLAPRMSTLTVIVLGEGLNGICQVLQHSVNSLGLTKSTVGIGISLAIVLYFIWILYFDGFRSLRRPRKVTQDAWMWLHAPFHLFLILMLQGLKNVFLTNSVIAGTNTFSSKFSQTLSQIPESGIFTPSPELTDVLGKIKMSWELEVLNYNAALKISDTAGDGELWKYLGTVLHNIVTTYVDKPDAKAEVAYQFFLSQNATVLAGDLRSDDQPLLSSWYNVLLEKLSFSCLGVMAMAGGVLISIGLLNSLQRKHRDRYVTGYSLTRLLAGLFLVLWGVVSLPLLDKVDGVNETYIRWIIPTIALVAAVAGLSDQLLLRLAVRSILRQESTLPRQSGQTPSP